MNKQKTKGELLKVRDLKRDLRYILNGAKELEMSEVENIHTRIRPIVRSQKRNIKRLRCAMFILHGHPIKKVSKLTGVSQGSVLRMAISAFKASLYFWKKDGNDDSEVSGDISLVSIRGNSDWWGKRLNNLMSHWGM